MYNIKPIEDKDFYKLLELNYKLQQLLPYKHNISASAVLLCKDLGVVDKLVIGLYKGDELVGFINGVKETDEIFYFSNIYIEPEHRYGTKKLMEYAEKAIIDLGYKAWKSDGNTKEGIRVLQRFGARRHK